ncbi:MAG: alpha-L-fucosidase [Spirochaetes bacterium]|nr:alpha-L-fucosidase [Spirochaetota bacterium]
MKLADMSRSEYEKHTAETRDARMKWWRDARFGMFIHYGLYSQVGRNEWVMAIENYPIPEYEKLAQTFNPKPGAPREWAALAKKAGMKYMVMTTRHHEGFSLWDSKANPYNSMNLGPKRDIVREFVDACREFGLGIGFYSSLMDWHHPDGWRCAFDTAARARFTNYIKDINRELMTNYGKIDILWYDVSAPMESWEGWDSLELNKMVRELQPDIIINNRSKLPEDLGTPEGHVTPEERDWEACMTFNDISWGYVDAEQAAPYSYSPQRILKMLNTATAGKGNLLLNIGPKPDGSVPEDAVAPLTTVGAWLAENSAAVYGKKEKSKYRAANGVCGTSVDGATVYFWNWIWPDAGTMAIGGFATKLKNVTLIKDNTPVSFEQRGQRIILKDLPKMSPDRIANVAVLALEFVEPPEFNRCSYYPQLHGGRDIAGMNKI